ncbi:hypothetical protein GGTG_05636 [Gaeumannomyces tritici R3-111a-1]|uniref:Uncharacterized protein n=1 Tax=Gaeumannomyces tritici (strain R3-111a-1) TaxID=644352 RepID=J3NWH2_GAET3|nr:hypothetical protein GGTG_05636 [Gaeumannomyces tritici R3-111a-1]EJT75704.1 hypothetical protein GGTG_05636 [Gaeumannomyces tritici R3-111a-1]
MPHLQRFQRKSRKAPYLWPKPATIFSLKSVSYVLQAFGWESEEVVLSLKKACSFLSVLITLIKARFRFVTINVGAKEKLFLKGKIPHILSMERLNLFVL